MNRFALVVGVFFAVLGMGIVYIRKDPLAYPLAAIGLLLIVISFFIPPHYLQSIDREISERT